MRTGPTLTLFADVPTLICTGGAMTRLDLVYDLMEDEVFYSAKQIGELIGVSRQKAQALLSSSAWNSLENVVDDEEIERFCKCRFIYSSADKPRKYLKNIDYGY